MSDAKVQAERVARSLRHRGPDAAEFRTWPEATLVHTRLSIIDLSAAGAQPMCNEDGTVWTICNGEIYNHRDLRRDLEARGHVFKGKSDSEVLPHLYEEHGPGLVSHLRGMFTLALYDSRARLLILARDRFGIKPLFYAVAEDRLAFASELRSLLQVPGVDTRPNKQAVYDFASLLYIPAPETFYKGVAALQPGEMIQSRLDGGRIVSQMHRYHRWTIAVDTEISAAEAVAHADALVDTAVARQIESDVPLGTLLSGGIDSSLVSSAAQRALAARLKTFNVRFAGSTFDETWAALSVAEHIGSSHTTLDMDDAPGTWERIVELLVHAGQPFADASVFAFNAVCRLMHRHLRVALSGDGGDEAFGGYEFYWQLARIARWQAVPPSLWYAAAIALKPMADRGLTSHHFRQRLNKLAAADDITIIQDLFS